jgi:hypothetical protein
MRRVDVRNIVVRRVGRRVLFLVDKRVADHVEDEVHRYLWTFCWQVTRWIMRVV